MSFFGFTLGAQASGQALGNDNTDRAGDIIRRHPHIQQPGEGFCRRVGMQGGEHQVPGLRGFDGNFCGFEIPDLTLP